MARTVTAHLFHAVNGVVESPNLWQFDAFGQAEGELMGKTLAGVDEVVIGRKLWDEWSQYWPDADDPFGAFINPVRKHVVSQSLSGDLPWNSTAVQGDPVEFVRRLKESEGGGIAVLGGIDTTRALFLGGVVDALTLTTHPAVGQGRRLFDESVPITRLQLLDSMITPAGNAVLTYGLRPTD